MLRISKKFKFDMAHKLEGHRGLCQNIHGHTYEMEVIVEGKIIDTEGSSARGMVMDYGDLKSVVKGFIDDYLDHAVLVSSQADDWKKFLKRNGYKCTIVPFRATAENMCVWCYKELNSMLQKAFEDNSFENNGAFLAGIRIWETPTSMAEYFPNPS